MYIYMYIYSDSLILYSPKRRAGFCRNNKRSFFVWSVCQKLIFQPCRNVELAALSRHRLGEVIMLGCFFPSSCVLRIPAFYP